MSVHLQLRQMSPLHKEKPSHTSITRSTLQSSGNSASTGKAGATWYGVKFPSFLGRSSCLYGLNARDASGSQFRRLGMYIVSLGYDGNLKNRPFSSMHQVLLSYARSFHSILHGCEE